MNKKMLISMLIVFLGCAGALTGYKVTTIVDEFDGYTMNLMERNELESSTGSFLVEVYGDGAKSVELNASKATYKNGNIYYGLQIIYLHSEWMFIETGESLVLMIDGERIGIYCDQDDINTDTGYGLKGRVIEKVGYTVDKTILEKLANAKVVKVKIRGSKRSYQKELSAENISNFKRFYSEYVEQ